MSDTKILNIKNLKVDFSLDDKKNLAVRDVSLSLFPGKTLGLVGESGCGKSVTAYSILQLISPPGKIRSGQIIYKGKDLTQLNKKEINQIRGKEIAMIFQEPMASLNPVFTIGYQIQESIAQHLKKSKSEAKKIAINNLKQVGIPNPEQRYYAYPHELSGGMCQRVMIAIALATSPEILIADEPTTALDVTIQAQILDLLLKIQQENKMSLLFISHDIGVVANIADYIAIMYAGEIIEYGKTAEILKQPLHPYTKGLFKSIPKIEDNHKKLFLIPGQVPALNQEPQGCAFYERCVEKKPECKLNKIKLSSLNKNQAVRCLNLLSS